MVRIMGDHRGLYVEFHTALFLGTELPPLSRTSLRGLQSKKAHQLCDYWEAVDQRLTLHNWYDGTAELQTAYDSDEPNHQLAATLDDWRIRATSYGESKVKPYPKPPYSPKIARLRNIEALLNLVIRNSTSKVSFDEQIQQVQSKLQDLHLAIPPTIQECQELRKTNRKELFTTIKQELSTATSRKHHLEDLISQREAEGNKA
jgi:hypothetical protein